MTVPAQLLKRATNTPECKTSQSGAACAVTPGNRYFPYVATSVEESWDLNGAAYPSVTSTYVYGTDSVTGQIYGDQTKITVTSSDGSSKVMDNEYWPANVSGSNWILGRLKRAVVTSTKP